MMALPSSSPSKARTLPSQSRPWTEVCRQKVGVKRTIRSPFFPFFSTRRRSTVLEDVTDPFRKVWGRFPTLCALCIVGSHCQELRLSRHSCLASSVCLEMKVSVKYP